MIEITIRLKPGCALRFAELLRDSAAGEQDRGQAKAYRGAARRIEHLTRTRRRPTQRPEPIQRPEPARPHKAREEGPRPFRYTPRVQRPQHHDIDERAVQRVVLGLRPLPVLSRNEARLACWYLTRHEAPASEIADRIRIAKRTVHRWRAEDRTGVAFR